MRRGMMYRDGSDPRALPMGSGVTLGRSPVRVQRADGVGMRNRFLKRCDGGARVWARARVVNAGFTRVLREVFGARHADVARGDETHLPASLGSRARREVADRWLPRGVSHLPRFRRRQHLHTRVPDSRWRAARGKYLQRAREAHAEAHWIFAQPRGIHSGFVALVITF